MNIGVEERLDEIGFGDLKIIQHPLEFCYGVDAVIAADFAARLTSGEGRKADSNMKTAMDLGTGSGIIPLILSHKTQISHLYGIELQEKAWNRALRTMDLNGLTQRIQMLHGDVKDYFEKSHEVWEGTMDLVISNPPYVSKGSGIPVKREAKHLARHETSATLSDFIKTASYLLKPRGHLVVVHRPARLPDLMWEMRFYGIEPKTLRFVHPFHHQAPNIMLVHGIKGGGKELKILPPLPVYESKEVYSAEILEIYQGKKEVELSCGVSDNERE
ncbi:MAG: methyltransferase [Anaerovoracaceae bacterium]|jgi:tRNA1Val (adenine37-N6)-methyltransferase